MEDTKAFDVTEEKNIPSESDGTDRGNVAVAVKYMGTDTDRLDMTILGRKQVLRRNFQFFPMVGFAAVLIATWELIFTNLLFNLTDGGLAGIFWGYTLVVIASIFIYLSIGEMASMSPTAGGQYHWVSEYAPPWCQKYLSYISGWVIAMGWQGSVVGLSFSAGTIAQALIGLNDETYEPKQWHGTLFVIAAVSIAIMVNVLIAKRMPIVQAVLLILHCAGLFAVCVPLLVMAPRKNTARQAFVEILNGGNWLSDGSALMIGLLAPLSTQMGYDCAVHMSEEIRDASTTLPKAILWSVVVNIILGYIAIFTIIFTLQDPSKLLEGGGTFPMLPYFLDTTKSYTATNFFAAIIIIILICAVIAEIATASRQIWAFSRDNGFPFSKFLSTVRPSHPIPLNAIIVSFICGVVISLVNLGSSVALNAIVSLTISALVGSYILSIGCLLWKRLRGEPLPPSRWSLGKAGIWINATAMVFLVPMFVFVFFPTANKPNAQTMNWDCLMFGGIMIFATVWYVFRGRKVYRPPVRLVKRDL